MSAGVIFLERRADPGAWLLRRAAVAILVMGAADWLLFGERPGLGLAVFAGLAALASWTVNPARTDPGRRVVAGLMTAIGILPVVVDPNALAIGILVVTLSAQASLLGQVRPTWPLMARASVLAPLAGPFRLLKDLWRLQRVSARTRKRHRIVPVLLGWLVPAGLTAVFLMLFADANPILDAWLARLDPILLLSRIDGGRVLFWGFILVATWPLLHVVNPRRTRFAGTWAGPARETPLFGRAVILRSLILFNVVFALQTGLDATYLWTGHALPSGMSHASYAHRGAYPLMVSALLAGVFTIAAARLEDAGGGRHLARTLLIVFVAQNILLVASAILRLDLYVDAYGMTYWRLSAFVWMGLVCFGLATIAIRILARKSTRWIVRTNVLATIVVLYACSVAPLAEIVARSNLGRCLDGTCDAVPLDWVYIRRLGPQVIPALDDAIRLSRDPGLVDRAGRTRTRLAEVFTAEKRGWKQWSLDSWRLESYLATHEAPYRQPDAER